MFARIRTFFSAVPGSVKGRWHGDEITRAICLGMGANSAGDVVMAILRALYDHADAITDKPVEHALLLGVLACLIDLWRRRRHGEKPAS